MVKTALHGPDNPRDWSTAHPSLTGGVAAHESTAAMRMFRAGHQAQAIQETLRVPATKLMGMLRKSMEDEYEANQAGRKIHDAVITEVE